MIIALDYNMGSDAGSIPTELMAPAQALIGFAGLNARNNAAHRAIWDAFTSNRLPDRAPIQYKLLPNDYEFPICKPKRTSYEWYLPKGILKRNWLQKHLNALPALVIVFFELDWNDSQWAERKLECAVALQRMRAALQGRNTRVGLALIQNTTPLPPLDDAQTSEKANALCATCDITSKMLFILPLNDHLAGYAQRLESAFLELSHSYYQQMARVIRSHKDQLSTAHQGLKTRHQFKLAVLSELRQDPNIAHKHYTQAYLALDEIRIIDNNCLEIKTVAGYINYKLCRTMFQLNLPRDAINQFKAHIDRYKTRIGCRELEFEHYSWLSAQYYAFAELFNEAVDKGLPAIQTQHPGYYYQDAARHSILRQKSIAQISPNISAELQSPSAVALSEFYGVRVSSAPGEPSTEQQIIATIQQQETLVDHSTIIINLLGLASSQFKNYRCTRMRRRIFVQMAEQYLMCNEIGKALTLFTHMLSDYRTEGVMDLWKYVHTRALYASCMTVAIQDYIHLSIEALSNKLNKDLSEQSRAFGNLERILQGLPPESEPTLQLENSSKPLPLMYTKTVEAWLQILVAPQIIAIDMSTIAPCFEVYASFNLKEISIDDEIVVQLQMRSLSKVTLNFSKLSLGLKCKDQIITVEVSDEYCEEEGYVLLPNDFNMHVFRARSGVFTESSQVQISNVVVQFGWKHITVLITTPIIQLTNIHSMQTNSVLTKLLSEFKIPDMINITTIIPRPSNIICEALHNTPALKEEWHKISLCLQNNEVQDIYDVTISLMVQDQISNVALCLMPTKDIQSLNANLSIALQNMECNSKTTQVFYVKCDQICNVKIYCKIVYKTGDLNMVKSNNISTKDHIIAISVVEPFNVTSQYLSSCFKEINYCYEDAKFIVLTCLNVKSPWPLRIEDTYLEPTSPILKQINGPTSQLKGVKIQTNEQGTEVFGVKSCESLCSSFDTVPKNTDISSVGTYNILWKREGAQYINKCTITLPGIIMKMCSVRIEVILPAQGIVRNSLPLRYILHSKCDTLVSLHATLDSSESFMFSGHKEMQLTLLPFDEISLSFNLFPLVCGYVTLPKLILTTENSDIVISSHDIPTHIFIMPQRKITRPTVYEIEAEIPKLEIS